MTTRSRRLGSLPVVGDGTSEAFPVFVDWDNDLDEDLVLAMTTPRGLLGIRYFERAGQDLEERTGSANPFGWIEDEEFDFSISYYYYSRITLNIADWDDDGDQDLVIGGRRLSKLRFFERLPSGDLVERVWPEYPFELHPPAWPFEIDDCCVAPAFVDWDGDGDNDLILTSRRSDFFYYEKLAPNVLILREGEGQNPFHSIKKLDDEERGMIAPVDFDLDGDVDLVFSTINKRVALGGRGSARYFERVSNATLVERRGPSWNPFDGILGNGAVMNFAFVDWNKDGDQDFVFCDADGLIYYEAARVQSWEPDYKNDPLTDVYVTDSAVPVFVDWDHDGDLDLITWSILYFEVAYFERVGTDSFVPRKGGENPFRFINDYYYIWARDSLTPPAIADWDGDGDMDVIFFKHPYVYFKERLPNGALSPRVRMNLLRPNGIALQLDADAYYYYYNAWGRAGPAVVDWDGDGDLDIAVFVSKNDWYYYYYAYCRYFDRDPVGEMVERTGDDNPFSVFRAGWYWGEYGCQKTDLNGPCDAVMVSPSFVDLNGDGMLDAVISFTTGVQYLQRNSSGALVEATPLFPTIARASMATRISYTFLDWDDDSDPDMVVVDDSGIFTYYPHGGCTLPTACSGNGLCEGSRGVCGCIAGYSGDACATCVTNYYGGSEVCRPCLGVVAGGAPCSQRGLCTDDDAARELGTTRTLSMLAVGNGECTCGEDAFYGAACEEGVCPAGTYERPSDEPLQPNFCAPCEAGHFSDAGGWCQACSPGWVAAAGSPACGQCSPGARPLEGQAVCAACRPGQTPVPGSNDCEACPTGKFSSVGICEECGEGHMPSGDQGLCIACEPGQAAAAGALCNPCEVGRISSRGAGACESCSAGREPAEDQATCKRCSAGWFAPAGSPCLECEVGRSSLEGAEACDVCALGFYSMDTGSANCQVDLIYMCFYIALLLIVTLAWAPPLVILRKEFRVVDIRVVDRAALVSSMRDHLLKPGVEIQGKISGSGARYFDGNAEWLTFESLDNRRLKCASSGEIFAEASRGALTVKFPQELYKTSGGVIRMTSPLSHFLLVQTLGLILHALAVWRFRTTERPNSVVLFSFSAHPVGLALAALGAFVWRCLLVKEVAPMARRIDTYRRRLLQVNPSPRATDRGALRAVQVGNLRALFAMFEDFIQDRNAYYLHAAITLPLTKPFQLSVAELMASNSPNRINFFVSHFWGTQVRHFVQAVSHHARQAGADNWEALSYWVCYLSNNQWQVETELGKGDWRQSSFFLALQDDQCKATCMVLDYEALPLTRSWCLFEVLQTYKLTASKETFEGLLFCTPDGRIGVDACFDTTLALAKRLSTLSVQSARASSEADEAMILNLVREEENTAGTTMDAFISSSMSSTLEQARTLFMDQTETLENMLQTHSAPSFRSRWSSETSTDAVATHGDGILTAGEEEVAAQRNC